MRKYACFVIVVVCIIGLSANPSLATLITTTSSGNLMFKYLSSEAAPALLEFGLGTPSISSTTDERDVIFIIDTGARSVTPNETVNMGYYLAGSKLDFYNKSDWASPAKWAFSSHLDNSPTNEDSVVFRDTDNSLGWNGSIVEELGSDTWILHMDDAWSYGIDDDDNEMVIKVWVDTSASPPQPVPEPSTILLVAMGLIGISLIRARGARPLS